MVDGCHDDARASEAAPPARASIKSFTAHLIQSTITRSTHSPEIIPLCKDDNNHSRKRGKIQRDGRTYSLPGIST
jgi:hypothetical protein